MITCPAVFCLYHTHERECFVCNFSWQQKCTSDLCCKTRHCNVWNMNYWKSKGILKPNLFSKGKTSVQVIRLDSLSIKPSQNMTCSEMSQTISGCFLTIRICTLSTFSMNFSLRETTKQIAAHPCLMPSNNFLFSFPTPTITTDDAVSGKKNKNALPKVHTQKRHHLIPTPQKTPGIAHRPCSFEMLRLLVKLRVFNLHITYSHIQWSEGCMWLLLSGAGWERKECDLTSNLVSHTDLPITLLFVKN